MRKQETLHAHNVSHTFRLWQYFRVGWATYFGFIFAAVNTIITTYYLAIDNISFLQEIFPTFGHYVVSMILIGIPCLIFSHKSTNSDEESFPIFSSNTSFPYIDFKNEEIFSVLFIIF